MRATKEIRGIFDDAKAQWEHLTIANDFVFGKVMLEPDLCREILEMILGIPIDHVEYVRRQEVIDERVDGKDVRLDVYVRDDAGTVYNVEMQASDTHELPRRARYYQALLALDQMDRGVPYMALRDAYVIFVCGFDLFGQGRGIYWFENRCRGDGSLAMGDGAHVIFLSAVPTRARGMDDRRIDEFLDYVSERKVTGALSTRLDAAVERVLDNRTWRLEYMNLAVRDQLNRAKGRIEGREESLALLRELADALVADGRAEDVAKILTDPELRDRLCEKYGVQYPAHADA